MVWKTELCSTMSMRAIAEISSILQQHNIAYEVKKADSGTIIQRGRAEYIVTHPHIDKPLMRIYVKHKDVEEALSLICDIPYDKAEYE